MFADDLLVMCRARDEDAMAVKRSLDLFFSWSGQEANLNKYSILFFKNTGKVNRNTIKELFGFKDMAKDSVYLGNTLLLSQNKNRDFKALKEMIDHRLEGWNRSILSKAGKETLIVGHSIYSNIHNVYI